jgi:FAD/FMN-containing dehydrogenase
MTLLVWVAMDYEGRIYPEHGIATTRERLEAQYEATHGHPMTEDDLQAVQATIMVDDKR